MSVNRSRALNTKMLEYQAISLKPIDLRIRSSLFKDITHSPDSMDQFCRVVLVDLIPQPAHQHVHDVRLRVEAVAPYMLQDHCLRHDSVGSSQDVFQQRKLSRLEG